MEALCSFEMFMHKYKEENLYRPGAGRKAMEYMYVCFQTDCKMFWAPF